jgi:hypothetical protein
MQISTGRQVRLKMVSLLATILILGTGVYGVQWHRHQRQKMLDQVTFGQALAFRSQGKYQSCIDELGAIAPGSVVYGQAQAALSECQEKKDEEQLDRAKMFAAQGRFWNALLVLRTIPLGSDNAQDVQRLNHEYSMRIIAIAEEYYLHPSGRFNNAVSTISLIVHDETNPLHGSAVEKLQAWQAEWRRNQEHYKLAQIALSVGDVDVALTEVIQISEHPHWNQHTQGLTQKIDAEQQRHEMLWIAAQQAIWQKDDERAMQLMTQLPDVPKWADRRQKILEASKEIRQERSKSSSVRDLFVGALLIVLELFLFKYHKDWV